MPARDFVQNSPVWPRTRQAGSLSYFGCAFAAVRIERLSILAARLEVEVLAGNLRSVLYLLCVFAPLRLCVFAFSPGSFLNAKTPRREDAKGGLARQPVAPDDLKFQISNLKSEMTMRQIRLIRGFLQTFATRPQPTGSTKNSSQLASMLGYCIAKESVLVPFVPFCGH